MTLTIERSTAAAAPVAVRAVLNYTRNTGVRPVNYTYDPPPGVPRNSGEVDPQWVTINNARLFEGLALDESGFDSSSTEAR